jgi:exosortase
MFNAFTAGSEHWFDSDGAYGLLVPAVVVVLFWVKRRELIELRLQAWWPGVVLVAAGLVCHLLGYVVQQPRISVFGMIIGIYGLTGMAWGWRWLKTSFFPFFLLVFCIPVGSLSDLITFPLRLFVTKLVTIISHAVLAIDVVQEGNVLMDPTGRYQYEVAAACSGIRSLFATVVLAIILGWVSFQRPWKRLLMLLSAVPLAVLGNLLRLQAIIIAAEMWGQDTGNWVHDGGPLGIFSLLPYIPAFVGLLVLEHYLRKPGTDVPRYKEELQKA